MHCSFSFNRAFVFIFNRTGELSLRRPQYKARLAGRPVWEARVLEASWRAPYPNWLRRLFSRECRIDSLSVARSAPAPSLRQRSDALGDVAGHPRVARWQGSIRLHGV